MKYGFSLIATVAIPLLFGGCQKPVPDDQVCANWGYAPGTPGFLSCMEQRSQAHARAAAIAGIMAVQPKPYYLPPPPEPVTPRQTTCLLFGNMITCQ